MQFKKLFKYLPIAVIAASLAVATSAPPPYSINNGDYSKEQIFNTDQKVSDTDNSDQLEYIRNDVARQDGVTNSIASIELPNVSASASHSATLVTKTDGSTLLYMWGANYYGQLGNGGTTDTSTPTLVTTLSDKKIIQIAFGGYHSAAVVMETDGSKLLYMWGSNEYGQLGNTTNIKPATANPIPTPVADLSGKKITKIALGGYHSAARLEDGSLFMWGRNNYGQLGNGSKGNTSTPTKITIPNSTSPITEIELGEEFSGALTEDNSLYMWGINQQGQLGNGANGYGATESTPTPVTALNGKKIAQIVIGGNHSAAVVMETDGSKLLYMWGRCSVGQLGFNDWSVWGRPLPTLVDLTPFGSNKIIQIALGSSHTAALLDDGSVWMWGLNQSGQLGNGEVVSTPNPTPTKVNLGDRRIIQISLSADYSASILNDGNLYMWGYNENGQLGFTEDVTLIATPTWMSQLGKDSHITAKSAITAKTAVDNLWVGGSFDLNGFKNSFNLINIPNVNDQTFAISTKPTYNNPNGTVNMSIKIKYYYDENGLVVVDTAAKAMTIGGFTPGPNVSTYITAKTTEVNPVVIDKWEDYVKAVDGKYIRSKLEEFLILKDIPQDAEFTITILNSNNITGILSFDIISSKIMFENGNTQNIPSDPFSITLNLTPRITKMTALTTGYPSSLTAVALKAKLFDNTGLVKDLTELKKYMTIIAPVDNAKYYLVENSWVPHTGDGTVKFDIYVDKYYDSNADEQVGSDTTAASKVSFDLKLQPEASTIVQKATFPDIRIDEFEAYIKSSGMTVESSKLGEFFELSNIPRSAAFGINNVKIDEYDDKFTTNYLTFDLIIDKFNQGSPATPQRYAHNYGITLGTLHQPTAITAKKTYDHTIRVDEVEKELNNLTGEALVDYLNDFLNLTSIPIGATIRVESILADYGTGKLSFEVVPSKIYNSTSDLATPAPGQFTLNLQFNIKNPPTDMVININYAKIRIDEFANKINYLKSEALYNYLVPNYVTATNVDATKLTARIISQDNQTGKIKISLTISSYYDADSNLVEEPKSYSFDYELNPKYQQTIIKTLDDSAYPKDITPAQFKQRIIDGGAAVSGDNYTLTKTNITFLKKFLSFESIPTNTVYTLTWNAEQRDATNGVLSFNLSLNQYYSADGDLTTNALPFNNLTLNLLGSVIPVWPETMITTKLNAPSIISSQRFLDIVYADGEVDNGKLSLYLDGLQTIPASGDITNIAIQIESGGIATFSLNVSAHYDAAGTLKGPKSFNFDLRLTTKYTQTNITVLPRDSYPTDLTTTQFKQQLIDDGAVAQGNLYTLSNTNISLLHRFLDLTTVPPSTEYILTWNDEKTSDVTGRICFNLIIDKYYNADGDLVTNAAQPFNDLVLWLANIDTPAIRPATNLKTKCGSPKVASANAFMQMIYTNDNHLIYSQLDIFVDGLLTIPTGAVVTVSYITENNSIAAFQVILSRYYDGVSADMINEEKAYNFEVNVKYVPISYDQFPIWWFIIVGLGAWALLITFIGFTAIRYQQWAAKKREAQFEDKFQWFETSDVDTQQIKQITSSGMSVKALTFKADVKLLETKASKTSEQVNKPKADTKAKGPKTLSEISEKAKTTKTNIKQAEPKVLDSATKQVKNTKVRTKPTQMKASDQVSRKVKTDKSLNDQLKQNDPKKTIKTDTKRKIDKSRTLNSKQKVDNTTELPKKKTDTKPK